MFTSVEEASFPRTGPERLFEALENLRRAWHGFHPAKDINKSNLGLLTRMYQMEKNGKERFSVSELAEMAHNTLPAVSQKLRMLAEGGYLERLGDDKDRRICYIRLTERGRQSAAEGVCEFSQRMQEAFDELGSRRTEELISLLHELSGIIERQNRLHQAERREN